MHSNLGPLMAVGATQSEDLCRVPTIDIWDGPLAERTLTSQLDFRSSREQSLHELNFEEFAKWDEQLVFIDFY